MHIAATTIGRFFVNDSLYTRRENGLASSYQSLWYHVKNRVWFFATKEVCVCVCVRQREREKNIEYTENNIIVLTREYNTFIQQLQREEEGAYVVTFSLSSLTTTAS